MNKIFVFFLLLYALPFSISAQTKEYQFHMSYDNVNPGGFIWSRQEYDDLPKNCGTQVSFYPPYLIFVISDDNGNEWRTTREHGSGIIDCTVTFLPTHFKLKAVGINKSGQVKTCSFNPPTYGFDLVNTEIVFVDRDITREDGINFSVATLHGTIKAKPRITKVTGEDFACTSSGGIKIHLSHILNNQQMHFFLVGTGGMSHYIWKNTGGDKLNGTNVTIPYSDLIENTNPSHSLKANQNFTIHENDCVNSAGPFIFIETPNITINESETHGPPCADGGGAQVAFNIPSNLLGADYLVSVGRYAIDTDSHNTDVVNYKNQTYRYQDGITCNADGPVSSGKLSSGTFIINQEFINSHTDIAGGLNLKDGLYKFTIRLNDNTLGSTCPIETLILLRSPEKVEIASCSATDIITKQNTNLPDGTYQALSVTDSGSATLEITGGTGNYRLKSGADGEFSSADGYYKITGLSSSETGVEHFIEIEDTNGCAATTTPTVKIKCPATISINVTSPPKLHLCGSETTSLKYKIITGGAGPFTAKLTKTVGSIETNTEQTINTRDEVSIPSLSEGVYKLTVSDNNSDVADKEYSFNITQNSFPTFTAVPHATSYCNSSGTDGSIVISDLTGDGLTYEYSYRLGTSGSFTSNSSTTISGKSAGSYQVKVTNSGCSTIKNDVKIPVRSKPHVTISGSVTDQICQQKGSAGFIISGHKSGESYTLQILDSNKHSIGIQNTGTANNTSNITSSFNQKITGNTSRIKYYPKIIVGNNIGCDFTGDEFTVGETSNPLSSLGYSKLIDESCTGKSNAVIQLSNTNNINGTYSLSGGGALNTANHQISGLSASKNYNLTITEDEGRKCSHTIPVNDIAVSNLKLTAAASNLKVADCAGSTTGSIQLNAGNGRSSDGSSKTSKYKFYLGSTLKKTQTSANYSFTGLSNNSYNIKVVDDAGCEVSLPVTIGADPNGPVTINDPFNKKEFYCAEGDKGSFSIEASTSNVSNHLRYTISSITQVYDNKTNSDGPVSFTNLNSGTYTVTVKDKEANCSDTKAVTINDKGYSPDVSISYPHSLSCDGADDGKVEINVTDYTASEDKNKDFTYSFKQADNNAVTPDSDTDRLKRVYSGLTNQNYKLLVTDAFGCKYTDNNVSVPSSNYAINIASITSTNTSCSGASNGTITVTASQGASSGEYTYELYNGSETNYTQSLKGGTVTFTGLQTGEYKIKAIDDEGCSVMSGLKSITSRTNTLVIESPIIVAPDCFGGNNGSIAVTISNDDFSGASYDYNIYKKNGSDYELITDATYENSTETFSNLIAGTYMVEVKEQGQESCSATYPDIEVNQPAPIQITNPTISCINKYNTSTGEFSITISEGNKEYNYEWLKDGEVLETGTLSYSDAENEYDFSRTGLAAATYTFRLSDIKGCNYFDGNTSSIYEKQVVITQPSLPLAVSAEVTNESCYGANDGRVVLSASGGWLCSEHIHTEECTNVAHDNCPDWNLGEGDSCKTADYLYSIGGGWTCMNTFSDLTPGNYTVEVMDKAGNINTQEVTIAPRPEMTLNVNYFNATCPGYNNGRVLATVDIDNLGKDDIDYTIRSTGTGSLFSDVNANSNTSFSYHYLPKGNYELSIEDINGCMDSKSFNIEEPDTAEISYTYNYILDKGESTGKISVATTGGNGVFDYKVWLNGQSVYSETENSAGGINLTDLLAGDYTLQVRDTAGCVYEDNEWMERTIAIEEPQDTLAFSQKKLTHVSCKSFANGNIEAVATGGWGVNYTYRLNDGDVQDNGIYEHLVPGTYTLTIADTVGVKRDWNFEITEPDTLTIEVDQAFDATCPLYANGRIETTVKNGIDFFNGLQFSIEDRDDPGIKFGDFYTADRNYRFGRLPKGDYIITVRDSNACIDTDVFTIGEPDTAQISIQHNYIRAKGDSTGEISVIVDQGNQWFDYQWFYGSGVEAFEQGQMAHNLDLNKLPAGEYKLMVRDTAGCIYESSEWMERTIQIREPDKALRFNLVQNKPVSCFELSDGIIEVAPEGGWGDYSLVKNSDAPQSNGTFNHLVSGEYTITITDSTGISWDSTLVVVQPDLLTASYLSHKDINCFGGSDGEIALDVKGGNEHYFISVDEVNWDEKTMVDSLKIGTYNLYVKDEKDCSARVDNVKLIQPDEIVVLKDSIVKSRCSNNEGIIQTEFKGGVGAYSYQWYKLSDDNSLETLLPDETASGIYNLYSSRYKLMVTDEHLCTLPFEFVVGDITDLEIDTIKVTPVSCFGYSDGKAQADVILGNKPYFYSWPSSIYKHDNDSAWELSSAEYELLIVDDKGCRTSKKFVVGTPDPLLYDTLSFTDPLCYGGVQGNMQVQATGGTPEYFYTWSQGVNNNLIADVKPGTYSLTINDSHQCAATFDITFDYQRQLMPFMGNDTLICQYDSLIINPGTYHTYSLVSDSGYNSSLARPVIKDPSVYYLQVTDADHCLGYDTLSLDVSYLNISDFIQKDVTCNKFANGSAHIEVSPAGWNHEIIWPDRSDKTYWNNLSGGDYKVNVLDDYGCKDSVLFHIYEPDTLNYAVTDILDPLCLGNFNGYIHGEVQGGVVPYTVNWNINEQNQNINELDTGYYRIDVMDANNCFYQKEFNFNYRRTLMPFVGNDTLICHYNTLPLDAGDYSKFAWTADNGYSSSKRNVEIKDPGTYYLRVTDADKCLGFDTIHMDVSYLKISDFKSQDVTCNGDADAWAQVSVSPANWAHAIEWTDGSANTNWTGLSGGNYNVRVYDTFGCEDNHPFSIYEPDAVTLTVNKMMDPLCFGVPDGEIEVTASGGRTPYSYEWLHGVNSNKISRLDTGTYYLDIYDLKNCHISREYDLRYETGIYPELGEDKVICQGNTVRLYPGYFEAYKWSNTLGNEATDTAWVVGDKAGYYVEVMDDRDCVGRDTVEVQTRKTDLTPEFLMASSVSVGDTLMIIEVSQPKPQSFDWYFSGKHEITEQSTFYCKVIFEEEGNYEVILNAHSYNCMAQARKTVLVTPRVTKEGNPDDSQQVSQSILSLVVSPNPTDGPFNAKLVLDEPRDATYYLVRIENGQIIEKRKVSGLTTYNEAFNVSAPGVYAVFVEVGDERRVVKVVVQ